jgi:hypothetical protein
MNKRFLLRAVLPAAVAVGLVGAAVPFAFAGEADNDTVNNKSHLVTHASCARSGQLRISWTSNVKTGAGSVRMQWYDVNTDPGLRNPHTVTARWQSGNIRASGVFTTTGAKKGDLIATFFDVYAGPGQTGGQIEIGRNFDHVTC